MTVPFVEKKHLRKSLEISAGETEDKIMTDMRKETEAIEATNSTIKENQKPTVQQQVKQRIKVRKMAVLTRQNVQLKQSRGLKMKPANVEALWLRRTKVTLQINFKKYKRPRHKEPRRIHDR